MIYLYFFSIFIFSVLLVMYITSLFNNMFYGVPQVSTFNSDLILIKKVLNKYLIKGKKIVDLGSGTGKMLRIFEKDYEMQATGYEIDFSNVIISKILNKLGSYKNTSKRQNYFKSDLSKFDFIYIYLFPELMKKVEDKIWGSSNPGTIIIVNAFKFKRHKPIEVFTKNGKDKIFIYKV